MCYLKQSPDFFFALKKINPDMSRFLNSLWEKKIWTCPDLNSSFRNKKIGQKKISTKFWSKKFWSKNLVKNFLIKNFVKNHTSPNILIFKRKIKFWTSPNFFFSKRNWKSGHVQIFYFQGKKKNPDTSRFLFLNAKF